MPESQTPIFVVSSGRTGSTLLAKLIQAHPDLLCVSDIFEPVGEIPYFDADCLLDGPAFFAELSSPSFPQRIAYWRHKPNKELLFLHEDDEMVSLLLCYCLPFIEKKPLALFARLEAAVRQWPVRSMPEHLIAFFDFLRDDQGKSLWVERTGGSLPHTQQLVDLWPKARFVHNIRDPRETAISMMTGSFFRLYLELDKNPKLGAWDWSVMPPQEEMASMLNRWVVNADAAFSQLDPGQLQNLRFEDLTQNPIDTLLTFASFVLEREPTAIDRTWAEEQAKIVKQPPLKYLQLDESSQRALDTSLAEAVQLLGY